MNIVALTYERSWELEYFKMPNGHIVRNKIMYLDVKDIESEGLDRIVDKIKAFDPAFIIEREFNDGKAIYTDLIQRIEGIEKAVWLIDTHCSWKRHKEYAQNFDYVFLAISKFVEPLKKALGHDRVYWLPLCYPLRTDTINLNYHEVKYPISFVGRFGKSHPSRTVYLAALEKRYGDGFLCLTDYNGMYSVIKRSKVSFNCSLDDDLNFRVWEILGSGTELVTDDVTDIHKIEGLEHRIHIYNDFDELSDKIDRILANDPNTTKNTLDNQKWVKEKHSLIHRHLAMLGMIESEQQKLF